ncbi:hypothetical protein VZT92_009752 [Zoarces viviparus]|uniref:Lipocalin/cytosolic fatty-acid binding domain-containing protein n=1 Tax=Zoarces viviparus TaxID=48416 RepID=A0AAW1FE54_ZOAVI
MNLWLSSLFLVAGLFLSSSALSAEECQPLTTPLSLADPSMLYGRSNFIMGYTDNEIHNDILKKTQSMWMNNTPSSNNTIIMSKETHLNGTCVSETVNATIDGNTGSISYAGNSFTFQILPGLDGFLVINGRFTFRNKQGRMLNLIKLYSNVTVDEVKVRSIYLMAKGTTLKDEPEESDLEHFKKQASCLGFSKEPDFIYDDENGFCAEGKGA